MQVLTSTVVGEPAVNPDLPSWDKVKQIRKRLTEMLGRPPNLLDKMSKELSAVQMKEIIKISSETQNNCNKFIRLACLGDEFMDAYEVVNTMCMKCTCVTF